MNLPPIVSPSEWEAAHQDLLIDEGGAGHFAIPRFAQMLEVAPAGFDRGDLLDAFRGAEGQQRRGAIDGGMRQPALGGGDEASGVFHAALLGEASDNVAARFVPGQCEASGREIAGARQIQKRGQQIFLAYLAGIDELLYG